MSRPFAKKFSVANAITEQSSYDIFYLKTFIEMLLPLISASCLTSALFPLCATAADNVRRQNNASDIPDYVLKYGNAVHRQLEMDVC